MGHVLNYKSAMLAGAIASAIAAVPAAARADHYGCGSYGGYYDSRAPVVVYERPYYYRPAPVVVYDTPVYYSRPSRSYSFSFSYGGRHHNRHYSPHRYTYNHRGRHRY